ncbi:uncharacterized protein N7459_007101 [Penicillium hispanicum]|uniref:uncharacterized protein n=1 Tax=Penicillium hispanicum TaxID=1080232 RepID=UPI002540D41D|nr:uncharacterized protein N7459_007101 [Penicillium hispanicum]KAJ5578137.1 hypothetical protein N7459_007101 [Penicillium hispanicum]
MTLPLLIIGAGLGGENNIPFKLFEQDGRSNFRSQGYRLRINEHGVKALQDALTPELFTLFEKTYAETASLGVRIKPDGEEIPSKGFGSPPPQHSTKSYTVDRSTFRKALLTGLKEHVFFGKDFNHYTIHEDKITASFSDDTSEDGALLVGADGVRSRVRKQYLPEFAGIDTGVRIIFGKTPITPELLATMPESRHHGMSLVMDPDDESQPRLMFESIHFPHADEIARLQLPEPYMYWVLVARRANIPFSDEKAWRINPQESAQLSLDLTKSWSPSARSILEMQDANQSPIRSILSAAQEMAPWDASRRVTMRSMSCRRWGRWCQYCSTAPRDAADLASRIVAVSIEGVDGHVIGEYEASIREFARTAIELSWQGGMRSFGLEPVEECEKILL